MATDRILVPIGGAWVDPDHVIGVDTSFGDEDPGWPNVKVILSTGQELYGTRPAAKVVRAIRRPEDDDYDEASDTEGDGAAPLTAAEKLRRRTRDAPRSKEPSALRPLRHDD